MARVSGRIMSVQVQRLGMRQPARMGTHLIPKDVGDSLLLTAHWAGATVNDQGIGIPWQYRLRFVVQESTSPSGASPIMFTGYSPEVSSNYLLPTVTTMTTPGITVTREAPWLHAYAILQALKSNSLGNPSPGIWIDVADTSHFNAVAVNPGGPPPPPGGGVVTPAGALGAVNTA